MFDFVCKNEYFDWCEDGLTLGDKHGLKGAQDGFVLSLLKDKSDLRILEMGGGFSRVLRKLRRNNECWNIDTFEGNDGGPRFKLAMRKIRTVIGQMGAFSSELPADYFDYVVSISVVEHIPDDNIPKVFEDCARVLKPGGITVHAVDVYLLDESKADHPHQHLVRHRLNLYREAARQAGLELVEESAVGDNPFFRTDYVSNPDRVMSRWNEVAPKLRPLREVSQAVSLKAIWRKPA